MANASANAPRQCNSVDRGLRGLPRTTKSDWPPTWMQNPPLHPPAEPTTNEAGPGSGPEAGADPWTPRRPPAVVAEIGAWPIPRRQRWGELCNQLEDEGVPFPESERRAYLIVKREMNAP
jgi:hypothetical protein